MTFSASVQPRVGSHPPGPSPRGPRAVVSLAFLVLATVTAACGQSATASSGAGLSPAATRAAAPAVPSASAVTASSAGATPAMGMPVAIKGFAYTPSPLQVPVGATVTWVNGDAIVHSVTSGTPEMPGPAFDSQLFDEGQSFTFTFTQPGTYPYFCTRHTFMRGEITVVG